MAEVFRARSRGAAGAPVVAIFFEAPEETFKRGFNTPVFTGLGPPRQALLKPGAELDFWGAGGFDAVMPTWPEQDERRLELTVSPAAPWSSSGAPPRRGR